VFVPPEFQLDAATEQARYDQHQNDPDDPGYRRFLAKLADPLLARIAPGATGLDFGSGPGPTLGPMLREAGMRVFLYDIFYAPDPAVWTRRYDFITASEVIEHLAHPRTELDRLFSALVPGGTLAVMTRWVEARDPFVRSRYIRDPTHLCFYSPTTCRWIARHWGVALELPAPDVALFLTPPRGERRRGPQLCVSLNEEVS
jgi:cyclopropane fatty-acyl-phospholipid synthase-like methyltransferase